MPLRSLGHIHASTYSRSGIFNGLTCFSELERRIEQLPTELERGAAFEVFVEAYLNIDEVAQAAEVWVAGRVPREVRGRLNLPSNDLGYDGVYRTRSGDFVPYQAKFRTARTPLPWDDLATFFGISDEGAFRHLLANSVGIAKVAQTRSKFFATRGTDFDRLDAAQLSEIADWVEGTRRETRRWGPLPHQRAALADVDKELASHDRAAVIMACGTGKTLVGLWAAEKAEANRILVLVPSLSLLAQTLHAWAKNTTWGDRFRYLCVCSDPTVTRRGEDEIEIRPEDADFPVRTEPAIVRQFLNAGESGVSVVFCTYQSGPVVGEAMHGIPPFDLGIFDEAHKTTGREGARYGFALKDKNLPIRKRLFLTATPRHYNISKRDWEGDFAVSSMDDESIYGRVAHRLTFAQAANQKIIVPYKVVISVVDSEMIDNALLDQSEVAINGDPVRAKWVAHQIALKRAVDEHDVQRIITFHSRIERAAAFASNGSEGVGFHLPAFQRFHVSGEQPTAERDEQMGEFARAERGVITNARCLTEGVDVPSVDMVAFMNPRSSKVDIVQAVGRAMRLSVNKTCGYVLIPLFLELRKGESLTDALERSDFAEIALVLNAMRDNDEELADIIQTLVVEKGKTGGFDESRLREKVEVLAPRILLRELAAAIRTQLLLELGVTWDERFGQLVAYKETHGDCNVPLRWAENQPLATWCNNQRTVYKAKKLSADRITRLEQLGFVWDRFGAAWEEMFVALRAYKETHCDCNVPFNQEENQPLAWWCGTQRTAYKAEELSADRIARLEELGFVWDPLGETWEEMFVALSVYKETHGDCNVPQAWEENQPLATWCNNQRKLYKAEELSAYRIARLEELGFVWDRFGAAWEEMFAAVSAYKETHGDCNVPQDWEENQRLARWCGTQRTVYKAEKLSADRIARLEQLGFVWDPLGETWEEMFVVLSVYKKTHGDCNVPFNQEENQPLATWCGTQRRLYKAKKLPADRIARLEQLGFVWHRFGAAWEEMFAAVSAYKETHGDCNVPFNQEENQPLATWCSTQRAAYKAKKLPADRIARLEQLGFVWDQLDEAWEEMFVALSGYKETHGDCNVPQHREDVQPLASWCSTQRTVYKAEKLSADRIARLEQLGFVWHQLREAWEEMFAALREYKETHGDCNVPNVWADNPKLGFWCQSQRTRLKAGKLNPDRIARLSQLGFVWDLFGAAWEEMFAAVSAYKEIHGDCNVPQGREENQPLATWCVTQRAAYKAKKLSADRIARLEQLGFVWDPLGAAWEEMFVALREYKETHGDCNVPQGWKENPQLGKWCHNTRTNYKSGRLSPDRITRLKDIGFRFDTSGPRRE